jgi:arginyl-tRNA--protein-N-Asp/Glu arginylyltransferase
MESIFRFVSLPTVCHYLPGQTWRLEYELVGNITADEYLERMQNGWRRFGHTLFRPRCPECTACRTLRVLVDQFRPNRSQQRARKLNEGAVRLEIGAPSATREKLDLYDCYHAFQVDAKGWPEHTPKDAADYIDSYVDNPFPVEEWCYYLGDRLIGVGYVDVLPEALSAIYFFYDPDERQRSLGTWNVLRILEAAAGRGVPHVYLGYYVEGCQSLEYKANFAANQIREADGTWHNFRE